MTRPDPTPIFSLRSRSFVAGSFETGPEDDSIGPIRDIFCQRSSRPRSIAIDEREREKERNERQRDARSWRDDDRLRSKDDSGKSICRAAPLSFRQLHNVPPTKIVSWKREKKKEKRDGKGTRPDIEPVASILFEEISISRNGTKRKNKIPFAIN